VLRNVTHAVPAHRLLDRFEDRGHLVTWPLGAHNQVSVLGHENKGPEREVEGAPGFVDRISQPPARALGRQESKASVTGERQLVGVPRLVAGSTMPGRMQITHR